MENIILNLKRILSISIGILILPTFSSLITSFKPIWLGLFFVEGISLYLLFKNLRKNDKSHYLYKK